MNASKQAGWHGSIQDFVDEDRAIVRKALETFIEDAGKSQIRARDGVILFLPSTEHLAETREHLLSCGIEDLDEVDFHQS